jgi:inosine-uridine nucleoside N-ribohydrolase
MPRIIVLHPGHDDAMAILLAAEPEIELCAITTVAGRAQEDDPQRARVCSVANMPVARGVAATPLPPAAGHRPRDPWRVRTRRAAL